MLSPEVVDAFGERFGERGRNRTYNLLIKSQKTAPENKANQQLSSAKSGKVRQNLQLPRNQEDNYYGASCAKTHHAVFGWSQRMHSSDRTRTYNPPVNSLVGCSKFNNFAAQMTTHEYA